MISDTIRTSPPVAVDILSTVKHDVWCCKNRKMLTELLRLDNTWKMKFGIRQPRRLGGRIISVGDFTVVNNMVYSGTITLCLVTRGILDRQTASWAQHLLIYIPRSDKWVSFKDNYMTG